MYLPEYKNLYYKEWKTWKEIYGITTDGELYVYKYDVDVQFNGDEMIIKHIDTSTGEVLYNRTFTKHLLTNTEIYANMALPYQTIPVIED